MKVVALKSKDGDGNIAYLNQIVVDKKQGIVGEYTSRNKGRQISLLSKRIRQLIDAEELEGLCLFRFYENITIEDLDAKNVSIGERLRIGESVQEITAIGKRCFKECKLIQTGEKCELFMNVIFTKVIKGGYIELEDEVVCLKLGNN